MIIVEINLSCQPRTYTEEERLGFLERYKGAKKAVTKAVDAFERAKNKHHDAAAALADIAVGLRDAERELDEFSYPNEDPDEQLDPPERYRSAKTALEGARNALQHARYEHREAATRLAEVTLRLQEGCSIQASEIEYMYQKNPGAGTESMYSKTT